jgi:uncharacterized protein YdhG (YjbR/CyaY superfamily)
MTTSSTRKPPYGNIKFTSINEYHAAQTPDVQKMLDELKTVISEAAPHATETISYNMPAFKQGRVLVYYAAHSHHIGFYPTPGPLQQFTDELEGFVTSKGAVQFPLDKPLPVALIRKMVQYRVAEEGGRAKPQKLGR